MSKPLPRSELDATRHGTLMECGCQVCRLLATVEVLTAEVEACRYFENSRDVGDKMVGNYEAKKAARSRTDAAGILPPTSTPEPNPRIEIKPVRTLDSYRNERLRMAFAAKRADMIRRLQRWPSPESENAQRAAPK